MNQMKEKLLQPYQCAFVHACNWALREQTLPHTVHSKRTRKYFELVDEVKEDGSRLEHLVEKDYPVTPEYVTSFLNSSDYRQDPVGAINRAPQRSNLGDISKLQEALGLDTETARHLLREFRAAAQRSSETLRQQNQSENKEGE